MRPESITIKHNTSTLRGRGFVANLEPPDWERYTHEIRDVGGFWAASFNLVRPRDELMEMFENGLDREVVVTAQSGVEVWEGYIDELALQIRGIELRKSLNRMANSVWVRYASGGVSGVRGTVYTDAASVAKYGTKQRPFSGGQAVNAAQANQAAQVLLSRLKSPDNPSVRWSGGGGQEQITLAVRCKGWWQKFYWLVYNQVALTGTAAADVIVDRCVTACGWFVRARAIMPSGTLAQEKYDADMWPADIMKGLAALGDSGYNKWIIGMRENKTIYFEQAASSKKPIGGSSPPAVPPGV